MRVAGALAAVVVTAQVQGPAASAAPPRPTLEARAVLPADTLAPGPAAGIDYHPPITNGFQFPLPSQPVEGFSAVVAGRRPGEYLAMPDNGFGTKQNSRDFLIRAYDVRPSFTTAKGGTGTVEVGDFISFRDPDHRIGFPIVREATDDRLLTGGDIDPESLQRGKDGDFWMGEEFGPWILHFDDSGVLLDPPFAPPGGIKSPSNPFLVGPNTQPPSRGFEAIAITPDGRHLYAALEGATVADSAGGHGLRRLVFEFDVQAKAFSERTLSYVTESAPHLVADMWALDRHRLVVIERDTGRGTLANFRSVYMVDLRRAAANGTLLKVEAVDLTSIPDPDLVSLPAIHAGDVGLGATFSVTCESIEAIHVVDGERLLLACDNNLPNSGRNPGLADDNEFIVVRVPGLKSLG